MKDKASSRALRVVNKESNTFRRVITALVAGAIVIGLFSVGMGLGPYFLGLEETPLTISQVVSPTPEDYERLKEALGYVVFCLDPETSLSKAGPRFGWSRKKLEQAVRRAKALQPACDAVVIGFEAAERERQWVEQHLGLEFERAVADLARELGTFCDGLGLVCFRGVTPEKAYLKPRPTTHPGSTPGVFLLANAHQSTTIRSWPPGGTKKNIGAEREAARVQESAGTTISIPRPKRVF